MRKRRLTRQIGVMLTEETYQTLISITDQLEISISELIRKIIEEKVNHSNVDKKYPRDNPVMPAPIIATFLVSSAILKP